jgi:hypothetical protein
MNLKPALAKRKTQTALAVLTFTALVITLSLNVKAYTFFPEYQNYVHTYLNSVDLGNWTYMEKPTFPVLLNKSQVQIGQNWSIVCPLRANHNYHVYCFGEWVNNGSEPKTDYDVYVYNPLGELEGYHTESAGLPEHLGTAVDEPLFAPRYSGNYTFVIRNDPRESKSDEQATFMIIENVECNVWHEHYVEGKDNASLPVLNTSWAYEFVTESQHVEAWIKVPETLDMYEARLYLMADSQLPNETILNDVPLAWEHGLYGDRNGTYGGYNLESKEYRGVAYASCESYGQNMFLNFTSPHKGKSLYHLALIGEVGSGTIEFLVKTEFGNACLKPTILPVRVHPQNDTTIAYVSNCTDLENATLQYSTRGWTNVTTMEMTILSNRTCRAVIPRQPAGVEVSYEVDAKDVLENLLESNGTYSVKNELALNLSATHEAVTVGDNVTVRGFVTPAIESLPIIVQFDSVNDTKQMFCYTQADGTFTASFRSENLTTWEVQARFDGNGLFFESVSSRETIDVNEPSILQKYSLYIGGGIGAITIIGAVVYWKKMKD